MPDDYIPWELEYHRKSPRVFKRNCKSIWKSAWEVCLKRDTRQTREHLSWPIRRSSNWSLWCNGKPTMRNDELWRSIRDLSSGCELNSSWRVLQLLHQVHPPSQGVSQPEWVEVSPRKGCWVGKWGGSFGNERECLWEPNGFLWNRKLRIYPRPRQYVHSVILGGKEHLNRQILDNRLDEESVHFLFDNGHTYSKLLMNSKR